MTGTFLFLGTGGSMGIPVIGCDCEVCQSNKSENKRLRPSGLLTIHNRNILIDCTPDYRLQALRYGIRHLEGVILTHAHHDHTGGIDDLRMHYMRSKKPVPSLMSEETARDIQTRYSYLFREGKVKTLVAKLQIELFPAERGEIIFQDILFRYFTYEQAGMAVNGIRVGDFAYVSDIRKFPETVYEDLAGVKTLVLSALRMTPSHIHFTVDEAVAFGERVGADRVWLTHIAHELDHEKTNQYLTANVQLAYDGLKINLE